MENKKNKSIFLLPVYFKKIGLLVMILAFILAVIIKVIDIHFSQSQRDLYRVILSDCFTSGLLFIAMSKDNAEDERTSFLRLTSLNSTFIGIVVFVMIKPIISLLSGDQTPMSALEPVNFMLAMYLLSYYSRKTTF